MKRRWYDHDPTVSMAVSLLQNASRAEQLAAVDCILQLLEEDELLKSTRKEWHDPMRIAYLFPFRQRSHLEKESWRLLEILKQCPKSVQLEMSWHLINTVYLLEAGIDVSGSDRLLEDLRRNRRGG